MKDIGNVINAIFEKSLGDLESKAQSEVEGIHAAFREFSHACDVFYDIDAEPYVQDIWMPNINALKSQKGNYAKALKHVVEKIDLNPESSENVYEKYSSILSKIDGTTNELLAINSSFKIVMYCFSRHLSMIKHVFSIIEKHRELLRSEITKRSPSAAQHAKMMEHLVAITNLIEESKNFKEGAVSLGESLNNNKKGSIAEEESRLRENISINESKLLEIDKELSRLSGRISMLTISLERPSRKHDHLSVKKRSLFAMITNPEGNIKSRNDYEEFIDMIQELRGNINSDAIDVKNKAGVLNTISELLNSDLYSMIETTRSLKDQKIDMKREISVMEGALTEVNKGKDSTVQAKKEIKRLEEKSAEAEKSIIPAKEALENLFLEYYKRKITIIL